MPNNKKCELTSEQKAAWDNILDSLWKYLQTPEGQAHYAMIEQMDARRKERIEALPIEGSETAALIIIRDRCVKGRPPSVREVSRYLGFTSCRSGQRVVQSLINDDYLRRDNKGKLVVIFGG